MLGFVGALMVLASLGVLCVAAVAVIRPLPKLRMPTRRRAMQVIGGGFVAFIAGAILLLSSPSGPDDAASPEVARAAEEPPPAKVPVAPETISSGVEYVSPKLPSGVPDAPVTLFCYGEKAEVAECEGTRRRMVQRDWPEAWRGGYQGARNVAFCLRAGCGGAVRPNKIAGCAWRFIIAGSGDTRVDEGDVGNLQRECGALDAESLATARVTAATIFRKVYDRELELDL